MNAIAQHISLEHSVFLRVCDGRSTLGGRNDLLWCSEILQTRDYYPRGINLSAILNV